MLRLISTRPLARQLLGNSTYFRPVRITSSPMIFSRISPRLSSDFNKNSSTARPYRDTELDVMDFRRMKDSPSTLQKPHYSRADHYWGFVIIRTTYTPKSDLQWPVAMSKLADWLRLEMKELSNASAADQELVVAKFRNLIADDKELYDEMPMNDAILRFEDILDEQCDITSKYSTPEHFEKQRQYRIPELVEQSLAESDPEVKKDLLQSSYWSLNSYICLVLDQESLNDLVDVPVEIHRFDLALALKEIREHPDRCPPARRIAYLKVAMRHSDFDLTNRKNDYIKIGEPDWYAQWAKWAVCSGLGQMHRSYESCELETGMTLELRDGEPFVEIYGQD